MDLHSLGDTAHDGSATLLGHSPTGSHEPRETRIVQTVFNARHSILNLVLKENVKQWKKNTNENIKCMLKWHVLDTVY